MEWSRQQVAALDAVAAWLRTGSEGPQVFRLFGFAGTGKTTLAKYLAASAGQVIFATFTGKAAHVLRSKGCMGAQTIHSLIYQPRERGTSRIDDLTKQLDALLEQLKEEKPDVPADKLEAWYNSNDNVRDLRREIADENTAGRRPLFELKAETSALRDADLLVIDEVSMVGEDMAHDLLSFGKKILVLGDPAQLPPVKGIGYFTDHEPDILLTDIHRQARDNPIIAMATDIRNGRALKIGNYGESKVIHKSQATKDMYLGHDQMLVGTNKMRRGCNAEFRRLLGRDATPFPVAQDKLVCLRNNKLLGLLNGSLWTCTEASAPVMKRVGLKINPFDGVGLPMTCVAHEHFFLGEEPAFFEMKEAECFDYGYALTCHKSQGSQWGSVLVLDESACFRADADRWLYTAVTRAAERVTVVQL